MNHDLTALYREDREERVYQPLAGTPEYRVMRDRDQQRRARVMELVAANDLSAAEDYYHAAWIMNHGDTAQDAQLGHLLALRAHELGYWPARWLAAATYDRWQMYQGKPQKYGTNYIFDGRQHRLWEVLPDTTDEERAAWDVPPLAEQQHKAEEATRQTPPLSAEERRDFLVNAPQWLKEAVKHWGIDEDSAAEEKG